MWSSFKEKTSQHMDSVLSPPLLCLPCCVKATFPKPTLPSHTGSQRDITQSYHNLNSSMRCKNLVLTENITSSFSSSAWIKETEKSLVSHSFLAKRIKIVQWLFWVHSERFKKASSFLVVVSTVFISFICTWVFKGTSVNPRSLTGKRHRQTIQFYLIWVYHALAGKVVDQQISWWWLLLFTGWTLISNSRKTGSQQFCQKTHGPQKQMLLCIFTLHYKLNHVNPHRQMWKKMLIHIPVLCHY